MSGHNIKANAATARGLAGLVIGLAGVVAVTVALTQLLKAGTCASGGPYVIARQCSSAATSSGLMLPAGIVASVVGIFLGPGQLVYGALFLVSGATVVVELLTDSGLSSGAKLGGYIIAAIFIPMGAVPLLKGVARWTSTRKQRRLTSRGKVADGVVSRVEELQRFGPNEATVRITYAVQPVDTASFEVSQTTNALLSRLPPVSRPVRIRYDAGNHDKFEIVGS
jgi:hypothetical protein